MPSCTTPTLCLSVIHHVLRFKVYSLGIVFSVCLKLHGHVRQQSMASHPVCIGHRGLGRQASLMWFNILGFWVVGFTSGWALTFKAGLGLSGIWIGILSGVTTTGTPFVHTPLPVPIAHCPLPIALQLPLPLLTGSMLVCQGRLLRRYYT